MSKTLRWSIVAVAIFALGIIGYFILFPAKKEQVMAVGEPANFSDPSIAVIPFVNISKDSNQEYFSDGLTDEIRNSLGRLTGLKVSARISSAIFKGKSTDPKEIGKSLGVHTVLQGTVQRDSNQIRISVRLSNAENSQLIWSEQYDESPDDIFSIQNKITQSIADKLEVTLMANNQQAVSKHFKTSNEAHDLYLQGRSFWNKRRPPDLKHAIELFHQAIAHDSTYAAAYAGIADCYNALGYGSWLAPKDAFQKALDAATRALELDPTLAEAHASLGYNKFYFGWDWAEAEQEFRQAIALDQNNELGYEWYGYYLTCMQRYSEAKIILTRAADLDPLSTPISTDMGFSSYYSGSYDSAVEELERVVKAHPDFQLANLWLGRTYQAKKSYPEAIAAYRNALRGSKDWGVGLAQIGNVLGVSGNKTAAKKILDSMIALSSRAFVTSYGMALVYTGLDQNDMALSWLQKAYDEHSHWLVWLKLDPRWVNIRNDKRYIELLNKMAFPQNY